jgi:alpha-galactosidase
MTTLTLYMCVLFLFCGTNALNNGVGRTPPLGWNTWKTCGEESCGHDICNEAEIKSVAMAMIQNGMQDLGYNYVNLDDCWASKRNETDQTLTWDAQRFPSGIPTLIDWLHSKGFKFGLYTSAGNQTCSSGNRTYPIPGSRGHYGLDAQTFANWQVDYVKLDWCGDIKKDFAVGKKAHVDFAHAMNVSGRAMFLEVVAGYFFTWSDVPTVANSWRFCTDHHDEWKSTNVQMTCRLDQKTKVAGTPGGWPFMDMLVTGGEGCSPFSKGPHCPGQTDDEYRTAFVMWSISQSPLIIASDVRVLTPVMKQTLLNKPLIDLHQSIDTPPGKHLAFWDCSELLMCEIWGREMSIAATSTGSTGTNKMWMVVLLNRGKRHHNITVDWKTLGMLDTNSANVYDIWSNSTLIDENKTVSFTAEVPSHGTAVIKIEMVA